MNICVIIFSTKLKSHVIPGGDSVIIAKLISDDLSQLKKGLPLRTGIIELLRGSSAYFPVVICDKYETFRYFNAVQANTKLL